MKRTNKGDNNMQFNQRIDVILETAAHSVAAQILELAKDELGTRAAHAMNGDVKPVRTRKAKAVVVTEETPTQPLRLHASGITSWTADTAARRVPTFVMAATGLKSKKEIVAKFGENAHFELGKPVPSPKFKS